MVSRLGTVRTVFWAITGLDTEQGCALNLGGILGLAVDLGSVEDEVQQTAVIDVSHILSGDDADCFDRF